MAGDGLAELLLKTHTNKLITATNVVREMNVRVLRKGLELLCERWQV